MPDKEGLADALASMTRLELDQLRQLVDQQLTLCLVCGREGAKPYRVTGQGTNRMRASLVLCLACFERNRLPEGRAE